MVYDKGNNEGKLREKKYCFFFVKLYLPYLQSWFKRIWRSGATTWQKEHSDRPEEPQDRPWEEAAIFVKRSDDVDAQGERKETSL